MTLTSRSVNATSHHWSHAKMSDLEVISTGKPNIWRSSELTGTWVLLSGDLRNKCWQITTLVFFPNRRECFFLLVNMHLLVLSIISMEKPKAIASHRAGLHLRRLFWNRFILQSLKGFHRSIVSRSLSSFSFSKKFIVSYGQLNVKDLGHRAMISKVRK